MRLEYFQMIDRVEILDLEHDRIVCHSVVPERSPVFEGHFPGNPLLPGVLMVETMAQGSGYLILAKSGFSRMPFLVQVEKAKMRDFVAPEAVLTTEATLLHEGSGFAVTEAVLKHDGKKIANAELRFRCMPFPSQDLRALVIDTAKGVGLDVATLVNEAPVDA